MRSKIVTNGELSSGAGRSPSGHPPVRPLGLAFLQTELERDYGQYNVEQSLRLGRIGIALCSSSRGVQALPI